MGAAAFFNGVQLWEVAQEIQPPAVRTAEGSGQGVTAMYGSHNPESPNFRRDIRVTTVVEPVDDSAAYAADLDAATQILLALARCEERLIAKAQAEGPVSWARDSTRVGTLTGGPYGPGAAAMTHGTLGGSWVSVVNRLVLCYLPSSGEGFVAAISARASGSITVTVPSTHTPTAGWKVMDIQMSFANCWYQRMNYAARTVLQAGEYRTGTEYAFGCNGAVSYATGHDVPCGDS